MRRLRSSWSAAVTAFGTVLLVGCGAEVGTAAPSSPAVPPPSPPSAPPEAPQRYEGSGLVLQTAAGESPVLCMGIVLASHPPQCGGPPVDGWDWQAVPEDSRHEPGDVRWGSYTVEGTYAAGRLRLVGPPRDPSYGPPPVRATVPRALCPAGTGAAGLAREALRGVEDLRAAIAVAEDDPDVLGVSLERGEEDVGSTVLVVRTRQEAGALEARLRERWGGALCMTGSELSHTELRHVQKQVHEVLDHAFGSMTGPGRGVVAVEVPVATPELQAEVDRRFGPGAVRLVGLLRPAS